MSVMEELQKHKGSEGIERFPEGADSEQGLAMEEMMQTAPIPGQSLTQDPENRQAWEKPPEFTDVNLFVEEIFLQLTNKAVLPNILEAMRKSIPVEDIAQKVLMKSLQKGKISPDLLMLSIEPVIYILISLATYAHIDPVLYPEDEMQDEDSAQLYSQAAKGMVKVDKVTIDNVSVPAVVPKSLLARAQRAIGESNEPT